MRSATSTKLLLQSGGGASAIAITSTGNVGIGTVSPSQILHVRHASNSLVRIETNTDAVSQISGIEFGIPAFTSSTRSKITSTTGNSDSSDLAFHTSSGIGGSAQRMVITSTGNVGIGTNAIPSNSLPNIASTLFIGSQGYGICGDTTVQEAGIYIGDGLVSARWKLTHGSANLNLHQNDGSGTYNYRGAFANSTGAYSSVSDERLKKLIEPIQYGLNDVLKFKPVSYLMENQNEDTDKRNLGFIAQDLEYIIPEIVNVPSSSNAVYSLQYTSIIPILIKAIQELNEIVTKNTNTSNMIV